MKVKQTYFIASFLHRDNSRCSYLKVLKLIHLPSSYFLQGKAENVVFKTLEILGQDIPCAVQRVCGEKSDTPLICREISDHHYKPLPLPEDIKKGKRWSQTKDLVKELLEDLVKLRVPPEEKKKHQWEAQQGPNKFTGSKFKCILTFF